MTVLGWAAAVSLLGKQVWSERRPHRIFIFLTLCRVLLHNLQSSSRIWWLFWRRDIFLFRFHEVRLRFFFFRPLVNLDHAVVVILNVCVFWLLRVPQLRCLVSTFAPDAFHDGRLVNQDAVFVESHKRSADFTLLNIANLFLSKSDWVAFYRQSVFLGDHDDIFVLQCIFRRFGRRWRWLDSIFYVKDAWLLSRVSGFFPCGNLFFKCGRRIRFHFVHLFGRYGNDFFFGDLEDSWLNWLLNCFHLKLNCFGGHDNFLGCRRLCLRDHNLDNWRFLFLLGWDNLRLGSLRLTHLNRWLRQYSDFLLGVIRRFVDYNSSWLTLTRLYFILLSKPLLLSLFNFFFFPLQLRFLLFKFARLTHTATNQGLVLSGSCDQLFTRCQVLQLNKGEHVNWGQVAVDELFIDPLRVNSVKLVFIV